jgi:hypothetical protein
MSSWFSTPEATSFGFNVLHAGNATHKQIQFLTQQNHAPSPESHAVLLSAGDLTPPDATTRTRFVSTRFLTVTGLSRSEISPLKR